METRDGRLVVIGGASRSGKTAYTVRQVRKARRVCAWDVEAQWCDLPGWRKVTTKAALWAALQSAGPLKLAYVAGGDIREAFEYWSRAVLYAGRYVGPLDAIAEELADVTNAGKANGHWGMLLRRGLKRGINIFAISQRWQEADKTAFDNASEYVFFRQANPRARAYVADRLGIGLDEIPTNALDYIKKIDGIEGVTRGHLTF